MTVTEADTHPDWNAYHADSYPRFRRWILLRGYDRPTRRFSLWEYPHEGGVWKWSFAGSVPVLIPDLQARLLLLKSKAEVQAFVDNMRKGKR